MSFAWVVGLVGGALAAIFGGVGWWQVRQHGRALERRDQAEGERDAAIQEAEDASKAPLSGRQSVDVLRRLRDKSRRR